MTPTQTLLNMSADIAASGRKLDAIGSMLNLFRLIYLEVIVMFVVLYLNGHIAEVHAALSIIVLYAAATFPFGGRH